MEKRRCARSISRSKSPAKSTACALPRWRFRINRERGNILQGDNWFVKPLQFMLIAGEASGDTLGAELISALRERLAGRDTKFFGVGGPQMQTAGMELIFDFARNAVFGLEALARLWEFRKRFKYLLKVAIERRPDAIICVDF